MWPYTNYNYWPYDPNRPHMMQTGTMGTGMMGPMMEQDQMKRMMAMMKEHMEMTRAVKETCDRIERRLATMEKLMTQ